jgi:hypothetical protein
MLCPHHCKGFCSLKPLALLPTKIAPFRKSQVIVQMGDGMHGGSFD